LNAVAGGIEPREVIADLFPVGNRPIIAGIESEYGARGRD
jgi:hypothetical protein